MRLRRGFLLASLAAGATFIACTLNPQPLPPGDDNPNAAATNADAGRTSDAGGFGQEPNTPPPPAPSDAGTNLDSEDGGDGDAGDAGDDAGDGGDADAG